MSESLREVGGYQGGTSAGYQGGTNSGEEAEAGANQEGHVTVSTSSGGSNSSNSNNFGIPLQQQGQVAHHSLGLRGGGAGQETHRSPTETLHLYSNRGDNDTEKNERKN